MTALIKAKYQAAGMKRAAIAAHEGDDTSAASGASSGPADGDSQSTADEMADLVAAELGIDLEAS